MSSVLRNATTVLREEGIEGFSRKSMRKLRSKYIFYRSQLESGYPIRVGGASATFDFDSDSEAATLAYIVDEEEQFMQEFLRETEVGDVVWDIGANIGVHSCIFGQKADYLVAFEPYPPNVERLEQNMNANRIDGEIRPIALSDTDGTETLSIPETETTGDQWPALLPEFDSEEREDELQNSRSVDVDVKRGDTVAEGDVPAPNAVKIDVEGAAHKVISGMAETLRSEDCRVVFVEVHLPNPQGKRPSVEDFGRMPSEIRSQLAELGFETDVILEREADFFLKAVK